MKESRHWLVVAGIALVVDFICSYGSSESYNDVFYTIGLVALSTSIILGKLEDVEGILKRK